MKKPIQIRPYCIGNCFLVLLLVLAIISCGGPKTYTVRLSPHSTGTKGPTSQSTVGLVPFVDDRPSSKVLGKRILSNGEEEPIMLDAISPSEDVTYILRSLLKGRNIRVMEVSTWEAAPENLKELPEEVDIAMAGRIEALEVEAESSTMKTVVRYRVRVSMDVGYREKGKIERRSAEVRPEETLVRFDSEKMEEGVILKIMTEGSGSQFDPDIIAAFMNAYEEGLIQQYMETGQIPN